MVEAIEHTNGVIEDEIGDYVTQPADTGKAPQEQAQDILNDAAQKIDELGFILSSAPFVEDMTNSGKLIIGGQIMLVPKQK